ncbi:MAG: hypothetical protein IJW99_04575 [Clostridia bacterium]|nr:hypothetical protein [Clostridia bacterium]
MSPSVFLIIQERSFILPAHISKRGSHDQVLKPESKDSGNLTPEAVLDNPATNDGIAQNPPQVNRNAKISSKDRLALPDGEKRGRGYDGYSMSNNARDAYAGGEMPLSKWSRTDFCSYYIA